MKFKAAITVFKKEMKRFFGDKRLCFGTIFLPGLLIFVMYTLMGVFISGAFTPDKSYRYKVAAVGFPDYNYFSRLFKSRIGYTPLFFRRMTIEKTDNGGK